MTGETLLRTPLHEEHPQPSAAERLEGDLHLVTVIEPLERELGRELSSREAAAQVHWRFVGHQVVMHGVSLSIASTAPLDLDYLGALKKLAARATR